MSTIIQQEAKSTEDAANVVPDSMVNEHTRVILETLESLPEPTRPKRKRKQRLPTSSSSSTKEKKPRTGGTKKAKPAWLHNLASLVDLIPIIALSKKQNEEEGTSIYFDVQEQEPPYNTYTPKIIRHLARKAREYPQLCLKWNTLGCKFDGQIVEIPLNGRHASRSEGDSLARGQRAFDAFKQLGCNSKPSTSFMKDLGYGAVRSAEILSKWNPSQDQENRPPTVCLDQAVSEEIQTSTDVEMEVVSGTQQELPKLEEEEEEEVKSLLEDDLPLIPPVLKRTKRKVKRAKKRLPLESLKKD